METFPSQVIPILCTEFSVWTLRLLEQAEDLTRIGLYLRLPNILLVLSRYVTCFASFGTLVSSFVCYLTLVGAEYPSYHFKEQITDDHLQASFAITLLVCEVCDTIT